MSPESILPLWTFSNWNQILPDWQETISPLMNFTSVWLRGSWPASTASTWFKQLPIFCIKYLEKLHQMISFSCWHKYDTSTYYCSQQQNGRDLTKISQQIHSSLQVDNWLLRLERKISGCFSNGFGMICSINWNIKLVMYNLNHRPSEIIRTQIILMELRGRKSQYDDNAMVVFRTQPWHIHKRTSACSSRPSMSEYCRPSHGFPRKW